MKMNNFKKKRNLIFFKRWINKNYAIFNSLKKELVILTLPIAYLVIFMQPLQSQDTIKLNQIIIESPRKNALFNDNMRLVKILTVVDFEHSPANNLSELLDFALGVDVRQRGADEVQTDISIRGGTFDQVLILLNGVPISDNQTGHHSFSIPIDISSVERIEILQGPGTRLYGLNAYTGAINIITKKESDFFLNASLQIGQFSSSVASISSAFKIGKTNNIISATRSSSDGYTTNSDYNISKFYLNSNLELDNSTIFFQLGLMTKNFGAYNFYTPNFPYQFEAINNQISSITFDFTKKINTKITACYRRNQDRFELFRESENWYSQNGNYFIKDQTDTAKYNKNIYVPGIYYKEHNYHVTNSFGVLINSNFTSKFGTTTFGIDVNHVNILSNVLGNQSVSVPVLFEQDAYYTKFAQRNNYSTFIDHYVKINKISISAGVNLNYSSFFNIYYAYGTNLSFETTSNSNIYVSVNQGLRLPTFTDLYYKGPSNIGNEDLLPEKSTTYELGFKYLSENISLQSAFFYRVGKNTIDWVKIDDNDLWKPMNYTQVNAYGIDFAAKIFAERLLNSNVLKLIDLNYNYLHQDKESNNYISRYVFDYPVHNFSLNVFHSFFKNLSINWRIAYKLRTGTHSQLKQIHGVLELEEVSYNPYWLADIKISYTFKFATVFIGANNVFNIKYYDLSNVVPPGRWIKGGIIINL